MKADRHGLGPRPLRAGLSYYALVFGAGFVFGAVRVGWLVPRLGVRTAELLEMPLMLLVIMAAARWVVRRFGLAAGSPASWTAGGLALALLVASELLLAALLSDRSPAAYIAGRDPVSGTVYLLMLGMFTAMPWWLGRRERVD